jgi:hypothetical protein
MTSAATGGSVGGSVAAGSAPARGRAEATRGTPEQVHLTWGNNPARSVIVSWTSAGQALRPRVRIGQRVIHAAERAVLISDHPGTGTVASAGAGTVTWTYHARVDGLRPGATYGYAVTADNDANAADPFSATFTTAPEGRAKFRFSCFGDLAPVAAVPSVVGAVETFQPLFHLFNGDLAEAPGAAGGLRQAGRDFGNQVQTSASSRPWLPVPGAQGEQALNSFQARFTLPSNGTDGFDGRWYAFRVGTAMFICLSDDDVAYADPAPPEPSARGYSGGAQTRWLAATLAAARGDASVDWIVVQLHHCACSSGAGSDLGIRREWLPLFDTYEVDLVLSGHDVGYERSFPVRGFDAGAGSDQATSGVTDTRRPHPVTTVDSGVFDTSQGTVHLVLAGGAPVAAAVAPAQPESAQTESSAQPESAQPDSAEPESAQPDSAEPESTQRQPAELEPAEQGPARLARVLTRPGSPVPDARRPDSETAWRPDGSAVEPATWSARRAGPGSYGIAVFDLNPGSEAGGQTSIIVRYYHAAGTPADQAADQAADPAADAAGPTDDFALLEAFTLVRPRSDGRRWHPKD